jgi:hypothetical protein
LLRSPHYIRDVTYAEDTNRSRTHNIPAVIGVLRDIVRSAFGLAGWANTASVRRADAIPASAPQARHSMTIQTFQECAGFLADTPGYGESKRNMKEN